ncbi:MAG: ORF6N domain-containing protein [bacterium]
MKNSGALIPAELIEQSILIIRNQKVILDYDLAVLYGVETRVLIQAVKRNKNRFPDDFMFQLSATELKILRSQSVISSEWGGRRYPPYAFTEQGVAMLSSIINSERAILVNIEIVRTFVRLRRLLDTHTALARKLNELEQKYDEQFQVVFEAIRQLIAPSEKEKQRIGFRVKKD